MPPFNTSYEQKYAVVSNSGSQVVLRVLDDSLYSTYWKEFVSAHIHTDNPPSPPIAPIYLRIEQAPPPVTLVPQYAAFSPEPPVVSIEVNGTSVPASHLVSFNSPNTEVPGLYRVDYRLALPGDAFSSPIWSSYVSVQQCLALRRSAGQFVRDSYPLRTLSRLVMEPQFLEALHAAGEPLYGFMAANQHPSVHASALPQYAGAQAWGAVAPYRGTAGIFITGRKLPQGSVIVYQRRLLQLREPVWPDPVGALRGMDENHELTPSGYPKGTVVRKGDTSYICINDADDSIALGNPDYWKTGFLYKFNVLNGDVPVLPSGPLPVGRGGVEHIWITVDDQGYSFWVDMANVSSLGPYRGYYDRHQYADYCTGDIVSYISEDSVRLYRRKATDIQPESTLAYPPGHHLNPAWEEIYAQFPEDRQPLLSDYFIVPHTNASNAIVSKTWSVSEAMCEAYGNMIGIPPIIVKECGAKWSALLFALLSRTRNTYEGLRICLRAVGLDIETLRLSDPSIAYYCMPDTTMEKVDDIYEQHANLRKLLAHIDTLAPGASAVPEDGNLRYVTADMISHGEGNPMDKDVSIQQYSKAEERWVTRYRFSVVEPSQCHNNRYYKAELNVLARMAEDAIVKLGDGEDWVKESAWAGNPSALLASVLSYEIPIYVYLTLHMRLYSETSMVMKGSVYSGIFDGQRGGCKGILELHPSRHFSRSARGYVDVETGVFRLEDNAWKIVPPTRTDPDTGIKVYEFDGLAYPIRIGAINTDRIAFVRYWQSTHTFGLLGKLESDTTDNPVPYEPGKFRNVTDPDINDETPLMLINGLVGVTALYRPKVLKANAEALRWMYVLKGEGWELNESDAFTGMESILSSSYETYEGTVAELKEELSYITGTAHSAGTRIPFEWSGDNIIFRGRMATAIYLWDASGNMLGAYGFTPGEYTLTDADWAEYASQANTVSMRIGFVAA